MAAKDKQPLTDTLRRMIKESGLTFQALENETGVLRQSLMKFVRGKQSMRLDMADKVAVYFGLEIRQRKPNAKADNTG
jgi:plasmid maintenance system antidote protein VapI